jgi:flagellar motor switch protein FliM
MLEVTLSEYTKAWGNLCRFRFAYQRSEMHTQFANVASPAEVVVATTFSVEIGDSGGSVHVCFPYATLEPIRDVLYSSLQGDGHEPDKRWLRQLTQQVQAADIELIADLASTRITVADLLKLRAGDFVELPLKELISVSVDKVPVMEARFGAVNGHTAIRIERMLKYSRFNESGSIEGSE